MGKEHDKAVEALKRRIQQIDHLILESPCRNCDGTGKDLLAKPLTGTSELRPCVECNGTGKTYEQLEVGDDE